METVIDIAGRILLRFPGVVLSSSKDADRDEGCHEHAVCAPGKTVVASTKTHELPRCQECLVKLVISS